MKKILAILSTIGLISTTSLTVVACTGNTQVKRFDTPTLEEKLRDLIMWELAKDKNFAITNGKEFNSIDFKDAVLKMVQETTSKLANNYFNEQNSRDLKAQPKSKEESFAETKDRLSKISQNEFYIQYTTRLLDKNNPVSLDSEIASSESSLFLLNPQNLLETEKEIDPYHYFIYIQSRPGEDWKRWNYNGENQNTTEYIPTIQDLEEGRFVIRNKGTDEKITNASLDKLHRIYIDADGQRQGPDDGIYSKDEGKSVFEMNGKTALEYRFQEYFNATIKSKAFQNLLTSTFLSSDTFIRRFGAPKTLDNKVTTIEKDLYYKSSSNLLKYLQSWNKDEGYKSNLKMIWTATYNEQEDLNNVRKTLRKDNIIDDGTGVLINSNRQTLKALYNGVISKDEKNVTNIGTDPFFGLKGFNGFVENDGDSIKSVDGNFQVDDSTKAVIAKTNAPAILTNSGQGFTSKQIGKYDIVIVLPIYAIDLLSDKDSAFDYGQSTTFYKTAGVAELWSSLEDANENKAEISDTKKTWITNNHANNLQNILLIDQNDASFTIDAFNTKYGTQYEPKQIWDLPAIAPLKGFQANIKNTLGTTYGNVALGQDKVLLAEDFKGVKPIEKDGFVFTVEDSNLYVKTPKETSTLKYGDVKDFGSIKLSFDKGSTGNVYTKDEISNYGRTVSYKINLGSGSDHPNDMVKDGGFDFYSNNVTSLDVTNLNKTKKAELLAQVEYITSKKDGMSKNAEAAIYPLFLTNDKILYKPLYEALKEYLEDKSGGTSD
ncbi:lipoprotein [Williamsoniiplasma lucivorax]|uniref:Lipoprotein n=1 Tax=Williamsoniiplasma lucivorax TaxID=209274 RepID=A0A2S5RDP1_9MOLU|nr:lipoprotein [Williamsoniiplasma lucivorax]PPE05436.1 hypothetical protein ELUCI_v1c05280 [Williamsoniiplasma lucivorax]